MTYSLTWLPQVLKNAGLNVIETPGWQTRGHGDVGPTKGIVCHHTGGPRTGNIHLDILINGRPDLAGPLCNLGLARDGTYYIIAAGKGWHAGPGSWQGVTDGNTSFVGIEAENTGASNDSPWPAVQMDAYRRGCAAILKKIGAQAIMCCGHKEYARPLGRKDDPDFDMNKFRQDVAAFMASTTPPGSIPTPPVQTQPVYPNSGKGSWYSQYVGKYTWVDKGDAPGSAALGVPDDAQGVSFYNQGTLGKWFEVKAPNGMVSIEQQTDIGPHPNTGRLIDISAAAAERFGYSPDNLHLPNAFPTDKIFSWRSISPPSVVAAFSPQQQAAKYRDLRKTLPRPPLMQPSQAPVAAKGGMATFFSWIGSIFKRRDP